MSAKLEAVIKAEIGVDDGREMPEVKGIDGRISVATPISPRSPSSAPRPFPGSRWR